MNAAERAALAFGLGVGIILAAIAVILVITWIITVVIGPAKRDQCPRCDLREDVPCTCKHHCGSIRCYPQEGTLP